MRDNWPGWLLWADVSPFEALGRRFSRNARFQLSDGLALLAVLAVAAAIGYLLTRVLARQESNRPSNHPWKLFRGLCAQHQLDRQQVRLLTQLAHHFRLEHPAFLFLDARLYQPSRWNPELRQHLAEIHALRDRLLAREAPPTAETAGAATEPAPPTETKPARKASRSETQAMPIIPQSLLTTPTSPDAPLAPR